MTAPSKHAPKPSPPSPSKHTRTSAHDAINEHVRAFEAGGGVIERLGDSPARKYNKTPAALRKQASPEKAK